MAKRGLGEQLDDAVEAIMTNPNAPLPPVPPRLAAVLRIAAELRDLPSADFKARLGAQLLSAAAPSYGRPLVTEDDIRARLAELAAGPRFIAHDLRAALSDLPEMTMRFLAPLNASMIGVSRFSTLSHWERHPAGDELLHILDGEADVITLTDDGPVESTVRAGSLFICPQGLWHQIRPRSPLAMLFATPGAGTEHTDATQPPATPQRPRGGGTPVRPGVDIDRALRDLRQLVITDQTTGEDADAAFREVTSLNECTLAVGGFSGESPWERHPNGDELLHVLKGEVDVTVLTDDGPVRTTVRAGSVFVCPRGLWHRQRSSEGVTGLYATPRPSDISWAEDPRAGA